MKFLSQGKRHYHLRHITQFLADPTYSAFNGSESASCLGPKIWEQIPKIKNNDSLVGFKKEIKKWKLLTCLAESEKFL